MNFAIQRASANNGRKRKDKKNEHRYDEIRDGRRKAIEERSKAVKEAAGAF